MESLKEELHELASEIARNLGFSVYDFGFSKRGRRRFIKVTIDKLDGYVSIADCESFSAEFGKSLDSSGSLPFSYDLVVESPGVERALRESGDFKRFVGEKAKVVFKEPVGGISVIIGKIISCESEELIIENSDNGKIITFALDNVKRSNLKL